MSDTLDYEAEIGLVVGRRSRQVAAGDWRDHVVGVICFNDGSVRGYQRHSDQVTAGNNFHASGAVGPCIVTPDEVPDIAALELICRVNAERRQHLTWTT